MVISQSCEKTKNAHEKEIQNGCVLANAETQNLYPDTRLLAEIRHLVVANIMKAITQRTECQKQGYTAFGRKCVVDAVILMEKT